MDLKHVITLQEIVEEAQANLDRDAWDYLMGGAETETTCLRNRLAIESLALRPRVLEDVSQVDLTTVLLGHELRIPVVLPPIGSLQLFHPSGAAGIAEAAGNFKTLQFVSSHTQPGMREVAASGTGPKIYQLYLLGDEEWMLERARESREAGYVGFCLTLDTQTLGRRERDWLKRWSIPSGTTPGDFGYQAKITWQTIERYKRELADYPLVLKGIVRGDEAIRACDLGVDVIYVTNHGGRQLDHTVGSLSVLEEIVRAVDGRAAVLVDGGFLRGTDVLKAIALGADAVGCGRLFALALAAGGPQRVERALEILENEIRTSTQLLGVTRLSDLNSSFVVPAPPARPAGASRSQESHLQSAFPHLEIRVPPGV